MQQRTTKIPQTRFVYIPAIYQAFSLLTFSVQLSLMSYRKNALVIPRVTASHSRHLHDHTEEANIGKLTPVVGDFAVVLGKEHELVLSPEGGRVRNRSKWLLFSVVFSF